MTSGKTYQKTLVNKTNPVRFTVAKTLARGEVYPTSGGCGDPECADCGGKTSEGVTEHRKVEVAITTKNSLVVRKLNYTQNRAESHQVFESIPHIVANLSASLPEEAQVIEKLNTLDQDDLLGEKAAAKAAAEKAAFEASIVEI